MEIALHSNADWATTPDKCVVDPEQYRAQIEVAVPALKACGGDQLNFWFKPWPSSFTLDDEPFDVDQQLYRLDSCALQVSKDGEARIRLSFKHTADEIWSDYFSLPKD